MKILNHPYFLALTGGLLLYLAWPTMPLTPLIFIAFVPFLLIEKGFRMQAAGHGKYGNSFFFVSYAMLVCWNGLTLWWICYASDWGGVFIILSNALLQMLPLLVFHAARKKLSKYASYAYLIICWLAFERFHNDWQLAMPWLTLGNGLAMQPEWIQWYSVTGAAGGTVWVWVVNILIFEAMELSLGGKSHKQWLLPVVAITAPILLSFWMLQLERGKENKECPTIEVVVVQPNIDPYNEKFEANTLQLQLEKMVDLAEKAVTPKTKYVVFPETAIPMGLMIEEINTDESIAYLRQFLKKHPQLKLITGASLFTKYKYKATATAHPIGTTGEYYDSYNSALQLDSSRKFLVYHKSKLVPGVESMPYVTQFSFLEKFAINMGGTVGSLGVQNKRSVFFNDEKMGVAPVICYESIFGDYVTEYVRLGANFIFIVTNDGWWQDTDGHRQHLAYARLRAIETRRAIARSANTGISCFIYPDGSTYQNTPWWKEAAIRMNIPYRNDLTFFVRHGDIVGWLSQWLALGCLIFLFIINRIKRRESVQ